MMILITYKEECFLASVLDDYLVEVDYREDKKNLDKIELRQCRNCGVWCSEDDELYGDEYCTKCAEMCSECEKYYNIGDMILVEKNTFICKGCDL